MVSEWFRTVITAIVGAEPAAVVWAGPAPIASWAGGTSPVITVADMAGPPLIIVSECILYRHLTIHDLAAKEVDGQKKLVNGFILVNGIIVIILFI